MTMGGAQHEQALAQTLSAAYPLLQELPAALREAVMAASAVHEFRDGAMVFGEHQGCGGLPLVLQGAVKVFKRSEAGREIVLYRVARGETCVLTSSCLLGGSDYSADGAAEGALRLAMVPASLFQRMIAESPAFRGFLAVNTAGQAVHDEEGLVGGGAKRRVGPDRAGDIAGIE